MGKTTMQSVTAVQEWRERMAIARKDMPKGIGQQDVLTWIVEKNPDINRLTNATRWRNAWLGRVADPELTKLVEDAAVHFKAKARDTSKRLSRLKLKKVK